MIEISTIQDIRQIENKIIGGFTTKQLLTIVIGVIINVVCYIITKSTALIMLISVIVLFIGFFKKDNLTAIEYLKVCWDKQHQPRVREYKNNNVISEIEKQCKIYRSSKKRANKKG